MNARRPADAAARREFGLTLLGGTVGAAIVLLAAAQPWARASFAATPPLPAASVSVTGHELAPATSALGLASLACLAAVLATRKMVRRVFGAVLAALGILTAVCAAVAAGHAHIAATVAIRSPGVRAGLNLVGGAPHIVMAAFPWWVAAGAGGLLIAVAGAVATWRGTSWPGMSRKYGQPQPRAGGGADPAAAWDALDRGADPTLPHPHG